MVGPLFERLLTRFGYGLVRLEAQEQERLTAAAVIAGLEAGLAGAKREAGALRADLARLQQTHAEDIGRRTQDAEGLWARLARTRSGRDEANHRADKLGDEVSRLTLEAEGLRARLRKAWSDREQESRRAADLAGQLAAGSEAHAAAEEQLWQRIQALRVEAAEARALQQAAEAREAKLAREHAAEADARAATLARVWSRLGQEQARAAALTTAGAEERKAMRALERRAAAAQRNLAKALGKLELIRGSRAEALEQIGKLEKRLAAAAGDKTVAKLNHKLDLERAKVLSVKQKLDSEQKRARRLAAELKVASADARRHRMEADRARGQEQRVLSELALAGEGSALGASSRDASDTAVEWLAKSRSSRLGAEAEAAEQFRLGRSFQAQGAIGLASACFRRAGPYMPELLAQEGPDGDRVTGPDFLVIGAARAGTTWLKKCLAHHPQVFILAGEHHYFSTSSHLPPESYVGRFANAYSRFQRPGTKVKQFSRHGQRLYGEKSTTYLAMPQAQVDLCAALFPKARLICLVRDPKARVWSHLKHLKMRDALQRLDRLSDLPPWMEVDELIRQGRYEEHLLHWARRFDPEQILLIDFERIAREPQAVYAEVLAHIGAEPAPAPEVLDDSNRTERVETPPVLADRLDAAFEGERFDIPYLRAAMQRAAEAQRGEAGVRRRTVRLARSSAV